MSAELTNLSIAELAPLLSSGELSPVELLDAYADRIEKWGARVNCFITLTLDAARQAAAEAERAIRAGEYLGPLHGIPFVVKDAIETAGVRTTAGSRLLLDHIPKRDAACVASLKAHGAVMVAKASCHEFSYGVTNDTPHWGPVRNPWKLDRIAGGSSGGSAAAVAARFVPAALGTDTGGSIRIPAAACGVAGIKPTYGLVPRDGVIPQAWSLDHVGPIAKTARDLGLLLAALSSGHGAASSAAGAVRDLPSGTEPLKGFRFAVPTNVGMDAAPDVKSAFDAALRTLADLGASIDELAVPDVEQAHAAWLAIVLAETTAYHWDRMHAPGAAEQMGQDVLTYLEAGKHVSAVQYLRGQQVRQKWLRQMTDLMSRYDALVTPSAPTVAPRLKADEVLIGNRLVSVRDALVGHLWIANFLGFPAMSIPCGFGEDGLPVSLMLMGKPFSEARLIEAGTAYEDATQWWRQQPGFID